jgi:hypothetical protein
MHPIQFLLESFSPGSKVAVGMHLTAHVHLVPRLRVNGTVPLFHLKAFHPQKLEVHLMPPDPCPTEHVF